jgi:hypothetical protein
VSYDIALFRPLDGETAEDAFARLIAFAPHDDPNPGSIVAVAEEAKQKLADALLQHMPSLRQFVFDYGRIAALEHVDQSEARRRWRHIELNEDDFGLQIILHDENAFAALPYWHEGEKADAAFRALWGCLQVLQIEAEYCIYDPQLGRILDLTSHSDFSEVLRGYGSTRHAAERAILDGPSKRPWWKFW